MAWSIKSNMLQAVQSPASCGSRTSCLSIGGRTKLGIFPYSQSVIRNCYIWNGTSWATFTDSIQPSGNIPSRAAWQAVGTPTNVLLWGGDGGFTKYANTFKYVGIAWATTTNATVTASHFHGMIGIPTNCLSLFSFGYTDRWNGISWRTSYGPHMGGTMSNNYASDWNAAGWGVHWGNGSNGQGYVAGGNHNQNVPVNEMVYFNGSSWATKSPMVYNRSRTSCGAGSLTDGLAWGGKTAVTMPSKPSHTEYYNGSTWSVRPDANYGRMYQAGCGNLGTSAITWGGEGNTLLGGGNYANELSCEEYLDGFPFLISGTILENELPVQRNIKIYERNSGELFRESNSSGADGSYNLGTGNDTDEFYVVSFGRSALTSWRMSPSINQTNRLWAGFCGSNDYALIFGGYGGAGPINNTEKWNGSSWSTTSALQESKEIGSGIGTTISALQIGGRTSRAAPNNRGTDTTELWTGSTWSMSANLNQIKYQTGACGDVSDALISGGRFYDTTAVVWMELDTCERWNGISWSTTSDMNNAKRIHACSGTASDALISGGYRSGSDLDECEKWNGSSWSATTSLPQNRRNSVQLGTTSSTIIIAGYRAGPTYYSSCYYFNGSAWSSTDSINVSRRDHAGMGSHGESLIAGGYNGSVLDSCEIWSDSTPLPRFNSLVFDRITAEPAP